MAIWRTISPISAKVASQEAEGIRLVPVFSNLAISSAASPRAVAVILSSLTDSYKMMVSLYTSILVYPTWFPMIVATGTYPVTALLRVSKMVLGLLESELHIPS